MINTSQNDIYAHIEIYLIIYFFYPEAGYAVSLPLTWLGNFSNEKNGSTSYTEKLVYRK